MDRLASLLFVFTFVLGSIGCSDRGEDMPALGTVHGVVTLDGQPVSGVSIYFKPDVGRQSIATTDESGNYNAMYLVDEDGVKIGPCLATLEWGPEATGPAVPAKYGVNSILKFEVKPGDNVFNIEMTSK